MNDRELLQMALDAIEAIPEDIEGYLPESLTDAVIALRARLAKPEYRRGDRLLCLETGEYCVIHVSGINRQWVKFPDSDIGVYTNAQVAELFELIPSEFNPDWDAMAVMVEEQQRMAKRIEELEKREWAGLTDEEIEGIWHLIDWTASWTYKNFAHVIEAKLKEKNNG